MEVLMRRFLTAGFMLLATSTTASVWGQADVIQNGSFETGIAPWEPSSVGNPDGEVTLSLTGDAASGPQALRVDNNGRLRSVRQTIGTRVTQLSGPVTTRFRIKIVDCSNQRFQVIVYLRGFPQYLLATDNLLTGGTWFAVSQQVDAPPSESHPELAYVEISVRPVNGSNDPEVYPSFILDEVSVQAAGSPPEQATGDFQIRRPFPNSVVLDATNVVYPSGVIPEYRWFVDSYIPIGTGRVLGHIFSNGGSHQIILRISDNRGNTNTIQHSVLIPTGTSPPYNIARLPTLGGPQSCAFDINTAGNVVGNAEGPSGDNHLALFTMDGSQVTSMGKNDQGFALARTINDSNVAAGFWKKASGNRAVRSFFDGVDWIPEELAVSATGASSVAFNINNAGTIVGAIGDSDPRAFVWKCPDPSGSTKLCPNGQVTVPLGVPSRARGINNNNQIVGMIVNAGKTQGFVLNNGTGELINLGVSSTHPFAYSEAYAINDKGQVVGTAYTGLFGSNYPFLITPQNGSYFVDAGDGTNALIKNLGRLSAGLDYALDINENGVVVGKSGVCGDIFKTHGFVSVAGAMFDINKLVAPQGDWILESAEGINDLGEIAGWGHTSDRAVHGFVMTPIVPGAPATGAKPLATRNTITLNWKDLSRNESGFEIDRRAGDSVSDADFQAIVSLPPDAITHSDDTVQAGHNYTYRIRAFNEHGSSEFSLWEKVQTPPNRLPVAANDTYKGKKNRAIDVVAPGVLANDQDADSDPIRWAALVTPPAHGNLSWNTDGSFRYVPHKKYVGVDTFQYRIQDGFGGSARGTVTLTVKKRHDKDDDRDDKDD